MKLIWPLAVVAAFLAVKYVKKGTDILNLVTTPIGAKIAKKAGFFTNALFPELLLDLKVENPNQRPITFNKIDGEVIFKGKIISKFRLVQNITVPGNDSAILKGMNLKVDMLNVTGILLDVLKTKGSTFNGDVTTKGIVYADGMTFPFSDVTKLQVTA